MLQALPTQTAQFVRDLDLRLKSRNLPPNVEAEMNRILLRGGKKVRPALCFLMGGILGIPEETMAPYARAAELTHLASIAHDDVIDEAGKRRNLSSLNSATSNAEAVLAGDLLLARVMMELSILGDIRIIHDLSAAVEDLVGGELLQLQRRGKLQVTLEELEEASRRKTGSLMRWCCVAPARLAQGDETLLGVCREFGELLGLAFQMVDDIIDFEPQGEKPFAQDLREGLVNFVGYELLRENPSISEPVGRLLGRLPDDYQDWPWTDAMLQKAKDNVRAMARQKLLRARELLARMVELSGRSKASSGPFVEALETALFFLGERFA